MDKKMKKHIIALSFILCVFLCAFIICVVLLKDDIYLYLCFAALFMFCIYILFSFYKIIKRKEKERSMFLSCVVHDLRSPVTSIGGFAQSCLDENMSVQQKDHALKVISSESTRLLNIISSLLVLHKDKIDFTFFDIAECVKNVVCSLEVGINNKNLSVNFEFDETQKFTVKGQQDAIYQAVYNLIENAVKYSPDNAKINIFLEKEGDKICFFVKNCAADIDREETELLGKAFFRAANSRDVAGSGLGLYIVKKILSRHSSRLFIENEGKFFKVGFCLKNI